MSIHKKNFNPTVKLDYKITAFDLKLAVMQYFRFNYSCVTVDEFELRGHSMADVITDDGKEIIEIEVKVDKSDLLSEVKSKRKKHMLYEVRSDYYAPNRFYYCVTEELKEEAIKLTEQLNPKYGVLVFNSESFLQVVGTENARRYKKISEHMDFISKVKHAKVLHKEYNNYYQRKIALRVSSRNLGIANDQFLRGIKS